MLLQLSKWDVEPGIFPVGLNPLDFRLEVMPGAMSTVIAGSEELIWRAVQNAFRVATKHGETVMTLTISNACPWEKPG